MAESDEAAMRLFKKISVHFLRVPTFDITVLGRIHFVQADYTKYTLPEQRRAKVVVVPGPDREAPVKTGVENFIRTGGKVLILTERLNDAERYATELGHGAQDKGLGTYRTLQDPVFDRQIHFSVHNSLGIPIATEYLNQWGVYGGKGGPWEVYVPSW